MKKVLLTGESIEVMKEGSTKSNIKVPPNTSKKGGSPKPIHPVPKGILKIPTYAKIIKGFWKKDDCYGDVWCKIEEIHIRTNYIELSLIHPKFGVFAWVSHKDCIFI